MMNRELAEQIRSIKKRLSNLESQQSTPVGEVAGKSAYYRSDDGSLRPPGQVIIDPSAGGATIKLRGDSDTNMLAIASNNNEVSFHEVNPSTGAVIDTPIWFSIAAPDDSFFIDSAGEVNIGNDLAVATDVLFVDASAGQVGIGTSSPGAGLQIDRAGGHLRFRRSAEDTWEMGVDSNSGLYFYNVTDAQFRMVIDGGGDVAVGHSSPSSRLDVRDNLSGYTAFFFNDGNASTRHGIKIQAGQDSNPSNNYMQFLTGNSSAQAGVIAGDGAGGVNYNTSSDERLKQDITPLSSSLDKILALRPVEYRGKGADRRKRKTPGFIAQEVMAAIPEAANYDEQEDLYGLAWNKLIPFMWGAIIELNEKVESLS